MRLVYSHHEFFFPDGETEGIPLLDPDFVDPSGGFGSAAFEITLDNNVYGDLEDLAWRADDEPEHYAAYLLTREVKRLVNREVRPKPLVVKLPRAAEEEIHHLAAQEGVDDRTWVEDTLEGWLDGSVNMGPHHRRVSNAELCEVLTQYLGDGERARLGEVTACTYQISARLHGKVKRASECCSRAGEPRSCAEILREGTYDRVLKAREHYEEEYSFAYEATALFWGIPPYRRVTGRNEWGGPVNPLDYPFYKIRAVDPDWDPPSPWRPPSWLRRA